ncbi:hypothetical protein CHH61_26495, partial [Shouchella clausii]
MPTLKPSFNLPISISEIVLTKRYMPEIRNLSLSIIKKGREQAAAYRSIERWHKVVYAKSAKGGDLFW